MDKRFFLALALAMMVAVGYQSIFVVPNLKKAQTPAAQADATKAVTSAGNQTKTETSPTSKNEKEEIIDISTTKIKAEFSNVGGSLHHATLVGKKTIFPVENLFTVKGFENAPFQVTSQTKNSVSYGYADSDWKIVKQYSFNDDNSLKVRILITNLKESSRLEDIAIRAMNINSSTINEKDTRNTMLDEMATLEGKKIHRRGSAIKFNDKDTKSVSAEIGWVAFREHYHALIVKPLFETKGYDSEKVSEKQLSLNIKPKTPVTAGQTSTFEFLVVVGNQDISWLKTYKQGIENVVAFSGFFLIDWIAKAVYYTVPFLHSLCKSWGFSIILVSLLIYGITYPLTMKSMASMRKMQLMQPKIAALQAKYKNDPQKLNAEMIDIYRKEGVNPLGGCLPFLLQMPVFMALYQILWRAYYFQGEGFLWIKDLTMPDRLFILPFDLPFLGNEFNILPILMAIVMFVQQTVSTKNVVVADEQQAMQQKMMKFIFPPFIGFIFYKFASGLSLYFTVFYALSAWTQWKISNTAVSTVPAKK